MRERLIEILTEHRMDSGGYCTAKGCYVKFTAVREDGATYPDPNSMGARSDKVWTTNAPAMRRNHAAHIVDLLDRLEGHV